MAKIIFLSFCLIVNIINAQTYLGIEGTAGISSIVGGTPTTLYPYTQFNSNNNTITERKSVSSYSFGVVFRHVGKRNVGIQTGFCYRNYGVKLIDVFGLKKVSYRFQINNFEAPLMILISSPKGADSKINFSLGIGTYFAVSPSSLYKIRTYEISATNIVNKYIHKKDFDLKTFDSGFRTSFTTILQLSKEAQLLFDFSFQRSLLAQQEFFNGLPMNFSFGIGYGKVF